MLDKRSLIPLLSHPVRLGQPYHGLVRGGELTLSNGQTLDVPWGWGDCYVLRVPGVAGQGVPMTPVEAAQESAAGRQWLDYAMLVGRQRNYAGAIIVGANAWLYAAQDGTIWRIECDQLDTTTIHPSAPVSPVVFGYYPEFLDFTFTVRRFGVVSPDGSEAAPSQTRTVMQQSLGARWRSDFFSTPPYKTADKDRRFPGDGYGVQWMPINIDDINSTGSRAVFCVNRSREQGMRSEPNGTGRAYPLAWIEVSVTGQGSLDAIQISMSLSRVQLLGDYTETSSVAWAMRGGMTADMSYHEIRKKPEYGGQVVMRPLSGVSNAQLSGDEQCLAGSSTDWTYAPGRCAGAYYDGSDALCFVLTGETVSTATLSASSQTDMTLHQVNYTIYPEPEWEGGPWDCIRFTYECVTTATASERHTIDCAVKIGPHALQLPTLILDSFVQRVWQDEAMDYGSDINFPPIQSAVSGHTTLTSVFGVHQTSDPNDGIGVQITQGYVGSYSVNFATPYGINESGCNLRHGVQLRPVDNCYVVRVTNKVYAVLAEIEDVSFASGRMVIAVGTPQGWTSINAMDASSIETAYNPVTGQLVTHPSQGLGWV